MLKKEAVIKTVSKEVVELVAKRMEGIEEADVPQLINRMGDAQPIVLGYLMAYGEEMNDDDHGFLIFLGLNVWQMMSEEGVPPAQTSEEVMEEIEERNIKLVESQMDASAADLDIFAEGLVADYNQPNIMEYILGEVMGKFEFSPAVEEENIGIFMLCLTTVIDCLDRDHLSWAE